MVCVCVKVVCEDGVCVCVKAVCERWCVTKLCVKDGVWVCVGERERVTKLSVKDGV